MADSPAARCATPNGSARGLLHHPVGHYPTAVMRHAKRNPTPMTDWVNNLLEKKPIRLVSVALANKLARIA
ncbi:MAG: hypothetical protein R3E47_15505 [Paracoccaceae bacterium]